MSKRIGYVIAGVFALGMGLTSCTAVLPPALYPSTAPSASTSVSAAKFATDVVPVLKEHCAACHSAGGQGSGAVTMFDQAGAPQHQNIKTYISDMISAIQKGQMPLGKPGSVPQDQVNKLISWRDAGAPNN